MRFVSSHDTAGNVVPRSSVRCAHRVVVIGKKSCIPALPSILVEKGRERRFSHLVTPASTGWIHNSVSFSTDVTDKQGTRKLYGANNGRLIGTLDMPRIRTSIQKPAFPL